MTNHHVVSECAAAGVNPEAQVEREWLNARVIGTSKTDDIAVLQLDGRTRPLAFIPRSVRQARLGEAVFTYGFPMQDFLASTGNFSQGMISAMAGLQNNPGEFQISVPLQPGNSGGPLVDASGGLVGVVSSGMNAIEIARRTAHIPQNVNFAIKGTVVQNILEALTITHPPATQRANMSPQAIAEALSAATFPIRCRL